MPTLSLPAQMKGSFSFAYRANVFSSLHISLMSASAWASVKDDPPEDPTHVTDVVAAGDADVVEAVDVGSLVVAADVLVISVYPSPGDVSGQAG